MYSFIISVVTFPVGVTRRMLILSPIAGAYAVDVPVGVTRVILELDAIVGA